MTATLERPKTKQATAKELDLSQGSDDWLEYRIGKATGSRFKDILLKPTGKGTEAAGRRNYKAEVVLQRLTGRTPDRFRSSAMEWGNETEELAATTYMLRSGNKVRTCGFFKHNEIEAGASPDRLVGDDGCIEIKCFNSSNHLLALKADRMPSEHMPQVQGHMWMTDRAWCDFVSFDPDFPAEAQIFIQRIYRDDEYISALDEAVRQFLTEVEADVEFIKGYSGRTSKEVTA